MKKRYIRFGSVLLPFVILSSSSFVSPTDFSLLTPQEKRVALTFDDGPRPAATRRLRRLLNHHNVVATFFVVGRVAQRYPDEVRALAQEGHEVANHSWSHPDIQQISPSRFLSELDRARELIRQLTGVDTRLFRVPGSTEGYLRKWFRVPRGYDMVLWDVHSLDQEGIRSDEIVTNVCSKVSDGDVVILHNGLSSTVEALDCLIPRLKSQGFHFVTVSTLLQTHLPNAQFVSAGSFGGQARWSALASSHATIIRG